MRVSFYFSLRLVECGEEGELLFGKIAGLRLQRAEEAHKFPLRIGEGVGEGRLFPAREVVERALEVIGIRNEAVQIGVVGAFVCRHRCLPDVESPCKLRLR